MIDVLHDQLQKEEEEEANSVGVGTTKKCKNAKSVVVEATKIPTTKPSKKRGRPKITDAISKNSKDEKKADVIKSPKFKRKPSTTKKKGIKPAAKKGKAVGKLKISVEGKNDKKDKTNVTNQAGDKANVTKKSSTKKLESKSKKSAVTNKQDMKNSTDLKSKELEKTKRERDVVVATLSKPKGGKKGKQQIRKTVISTSVTKKPKGSAKRMDKVKNETVVIKGVAKTSGKVVAKKPIDVAKQRKNKIGKNNKPVKSAKKNKEGKILTKNEMKLPSRKAAVIKKLGKPKIDLTKKSKKKKGDSGKAEKVKVGSPKMVVKAKTDRIKNKLDKTITDSVKKRIDKTRTDFTKNAEKLKNKSKAKRDSVKKDKKRPSGSDPPVNFKPAKKKRKQKPPKKKTLQIKYGVFLESDLNKASNLPIPERTEECDMSKFEIFDNGMVFLCSNSTERDCLEKNLFGSPAGNFERIEKITSTTALFLYRVDRPVLHGVWIAEGKPKMDLDKELWNGRFPAQVRVKEFHRFPVALPGKKLRNFFQMKRLFRSSSLLTRDQINILFMEMNNYNTRLNLGPLAVPLLGVESVLQPKAIEPTVMQQLEMLNQHINPNPRKMRKWCLMQVERDPRMSPQYPEDQWRQSWYDGRQQQNFWSWRGGPAGFRGYNRGPIYHRGGFRANRRSSGGRRKNFTPGAVRQEDIEKSLRVQDSLAEIVKKKPDDVKKASTGSRKDPEDVKNDSDGVNEHSEKFPIGVLKNSKSKEKTILLAEPDKPTSDGKVAEVKTVQSTNASEEASKRSSFKEAPEKALTTSDTSEKKAVAKEEH